MGEVEFVIAGEGQQRRVTVSGNATIGRSEDCQVWLDHPLVSRRHARISEDPFGRWFIEDLKSHNGLWINGIRKESQVIVPGDRIQIGPFVLSLGRRAMPALGDATVAFQGRTLLDDPGLELTTASVDKGQALSGKHLKILNSISDFLTELPSGASLYPEACRLLGQQLQGRWAIVRLSRSTRDTAQSPLVLASDEAAGYSEKRVFSRKVLEVVSKESAAVMASNVRFAPNQLDLTIGNDTCARAVFCAPIDGDAEQLDALYVELPTEQAWPDGLDLIAALGRQVRLAGKTLQLAAECAKRVALDRQLEYAHDIQNRLMPASLDLDPKVDLALHYVPAMWVGGDYCDVWLRHDGKMAFAVGDVCGKGLPAAMVMSNLQAALRAATDFSPDLSAALGYVNRHLRQHLPDGMFVTLFLGILDCGTGQLDFINAGHILPIKVDPSGGAKTIGCPRNTPLGIRADGFVAETDSLRASQGLVLVTDGATEAQSPDGALFGTEAVAAALSASKPASSRAAVKAVVDAVAGFQQDMSLQDDMTVFAIFRKGNDNAS